MFGLRATPASTASLLLNFECVGTTVLAVFLFREHVGKRTWMAVGLITLSSMILSFQSGSLGSRRRARHPRRMYPVGPG